MRVGIFSGDHVADGRCSSGCAASPGMEGADLAQRGHDRASRTSCRRVGEKRFTVAALDLGIKAQHPAAHGASAAARCTCCRRRATADDLLAVAPDGVFFCNGPGDPATTDDAVDALRGVLERGRAAASASASATRSSAGRSGLGTYKLRYGHRGVNQPVQDRATGRVARHQPQPRLRRRRAGRRHARRHAVRPSARSATSTSTTTSSRGCGCSTRAAFSRAVPPGGGPRAARRDRPVRRSSPT